YVKEGHVSGVVFDHTSIYRTLSHLWGMPPLSLRERSAMPIWDLLDDERIARGAPRAPVTLPTLEVSDAELYAPSCVPDLSGIGLKLREGVTGLTGQPELEALLWQRF